MIVFSFCDTLFPCLNQKNLLLNLLRIHLLLAQPQKHPRLQMRLPAKRKEKSEDEH